MNQTALLERATEVHAEITKAKSSYDPFEIDNFVEAIQNLPDDQTDTYRKLCIMTEEADANINKSESIIQQARCHRYLMNCIKIWWKEAELINRHPALDGDC